MIRDHEIVFNFHSSNMLMAKAIKWRTSSSYSHVSINMNGTIYESRFFKGVIKNYGIKYNDITLKTRIKVTKKTYDNYLNFLNKQVGLGYDYKAIGGFILNKRLENDKGFFCSELANMFWYFEISGYEKCSNKLVSPHNMANRLKFYNYAKDNKEF